MSTYLDVERKGSVLTSRNHFKVKQVRALQGRAERDASGLFFAEGTRFVAQAVENGAEIETVVAAPGMMRGSFGRKLLHRLRRAGTPVLEVSPEVFHSFSLAEEPQGLGVVVRQAWTPLSLAHPAQGLCWLALSAVHSPGNLGTIIRTADAVGAGGFLFIGEEPDPYHPAAVRASMGALFTQRFVRATPEAFLAWKEEHRPRLVGTSPAGTADYRAVEYRPPLVLFIGGERHGLTEDEQAVCDLLVRIPMVGKSDSLNVAVAAGVMLYEVFGQRR